MKIFHAAFAALLITGSMFVQPAHAQSKPQEFLSHELHRRTCGRSHCLPFCRWAGTAPPRRIARYPRRHPGHRLSRRRDGRLRGAGQRC